MNHSDQNIYSHTVWQRIESKKHDGSDLSRVVEAELISAYAAGVVRDEDLSADELATVRSHRGLVSTLSKSAQDEHAGRDERPVSIPIAPRNVQRSGSRSIPRWAPPVLVAACLAFVASVGWIVSTGVSKNGGPDGYPVAVGPNNGYDDPEAIEWDQLFAGSTSVSVVGVGDALSTDDINWDAFGQIEQRIADRGGTMGGGTDRSHWRTAAVIVRLPDGHASGVFIDSEGWILTNFHVVETAWREASLRGTAANVGILTARMNGRVLERVPGELRATVYRVDPARDMALLKLDEPLADIFAVSLGEPQDFGVCYKIGSPGGDAAWNFEVGDVTNRYRFPQQITDSVIRGASDHGREGSMHRIRAIVLRSNIPTAPGDSGGPLLNENGQLIGLTFATPSTMSGGAVGLHIDVEEISRFIAEMPESPEVGPFDLWSAGFTDGRIGRYQMIESGGVSTPSIAAFEYVRPRSAGSTERIGEGIFVGQNGVPPSVVSGPSGYLFPQGMWGSSEDVGNFPFVFAMVRTVAGALVCECRNEDGTSIQRIDLNGDGIADLLYVQSADGRWRLGEPGQQVLILDCLPESTAVIVRRIAGSLSVNPGGSGKGGQSPSPSSGSRPRGPNVIR